MDAAVRGLYVSEEEAMCLPGSRRDGGGWIGRPHRDGTGLGSVPPGRWRRTQHML